MDKRYNRISLAFGISGILLQVMAIALLPLLPYGDTDTAAWRAMAALLLVALLPVGTILLIVGLGYYAKAKGQSAVWCLMGFLSLLGLIVLACLKDRAKEGT